MAKKTKKLSLKRETLRSLTNDQLLAVGGGSELGGSKYANGGLKGTVPSGPTKTDTTSIASIEVHNNYGY